MADCYPMLRIEVCETLPDNAALFVGSHRDHYQVVGFVDGKVAGPVNVSKEEIAVEVLEAVE